MARITTTEHEFLRQQIYRLIGSSYGITEAEIAADLQMQRRRINNYLRGLKQQNRIYRDGRYWVLER